MIESVHNDFVEGRQNISMKNVTKPLNQLNSHYNSITITINTSIYYKP